MRTTCICCDLCPKHCACCSACDSGGQANGTERCAGCEKTRRATDTPAAARPASRWIDFIEQPRPASRKTPVFDVVKKREGKASAGEEGMLHALGQVRWFGAWRCYAFFPANGTLFEPTCLGDLAAFCAWLMAKRKAVRA